MPNESHGIPDGYDYEGAKKRLRRQMAKRREQASPVVNPPVAAPRVPERGEEREMELQRQLLNRANWLEFAGFILSGDIQLKTPSEIDSALLGLEAIPNSGQCQLAASYLKSQRERTKRHERKTR